MPRAVRPHYPDLEITDDDVREAMEELPGYLDITPGDFRELYRAALRHAWRRLRNSMTAQELMTSPAVAVTLDTALGEVAERMAREGVSGVPVVDAQGHPVGMISEADFLGLMTGTRDAGFMGVVAQCLRGKQCLAVPLREQQAGDLMSSPPVTVRQEATVSEIATVMTKRGVNRLPVVSAQDDVVGIVSRADLLRAHLV